MPQEELVIVIGAGVIGLSTACQLQTEGYQVLIVSELNPDSPKSIKYTSCWAGAHHVSVATKAASKSRPGISQHELDMETFRRMQEMMQVDPDVPLMMLPQIEYRGEIRAATLSGGSGVDQFSLLSKYSPFYRTLEPSELPPGVIHGASFDTIYIDTPNYLKYLFKRFLTSGGKYHQALLSSLSSVLELNLSSDERLSEFMTNSRIIINCTGIGAYDLAGVEDKDVYPTRGQTVLVRAPWVKRGITRTGKEGEGIYTYIIPRKSGDVIIGGTAEVGDWESTPREETTKMILERGLALCPELLPEDKRAGGRIEDLDIIEAGCGLRPTRKGGMRIGQEILHHHGADIQVVHNYGHGGYGYQSSWGSAKVAVALMKKGLSTVEFPIY